MTRPLNRPHLKPTIAALTQESAVCELSGAV
jgi:hypothetical protein